MDRSRAVGRRVLQAVPPRRRTASRKVRPRGLDAPYDAIVIGACGGVGSATMFHLASRGARVLGLDRFAPGHDRGSSHGRTRVIRLDYFEHPSYVPLLRRAYELWHELEQSSDQKLIHITGIVEIGAPDGMLITGVLASIKQHS